MKFTFTSALLCASLFCSAQVQWAFKAGGQINTASYKTAGVKNSASIIGGFNAGIVTKIYFDDNVAFITGLQYNAKGYAVIDTVGKPEKTFRLNYVDIPILLQIDLSKKRGKGFYCKVGPSIGIAVYGKQTYTDGDGKFVSTKAIMNVTGNHLGAFDASLNVVFGYNLTKKFFAEAAYAYGIGNINNDPDGSNIKTRVLSLSLGYFFR